MYHEKKAAHQLYIYGVDTKIYLLCKEDMF
jgi:hypothetical protein